jgi:DNA-binding NarL/FixJ family response regulator
MALCVLIVDDNASIRAALCELFSSQADFAVCGEAENGQEAIERAQELRPDLIVMDISMPVMNGLDAARMLRQMMPTLPMIMFSAYADEFTKREVRLAGGSALISKSENLSVLVGQARALLERPAA